MRPRYVALLLLACCTVLAAVVFWLKVMHFLGWDGQSSDYYAAWSSSIPAIFTLLGMSTIVSGLWHSVNCHERGCWRFGRHKVSGTPWCNVHHEKSRPSLSAEELLTQILAELRQLR